MGIRHGDVASRSLGFQLSASGQRSSVNVASMLPGRLVCTLSLLAPSLIWAQTNTAVPSSPAEATSPAGPAPSPATAATAPVAVPLNNDRILKIIPNYQTVENSDCNIAPMTAKEKWHLVWKSVTDPFNIGSAALGAAWSQSTGATPKYGHGGEALGQRFGAAIGDFGSQTFFSAGVFATVLHQDPRYFRKGPRYGFWVRVSDSLKQIVVARQDSGAKTFNTSNMLGMAAGIGLSNAYYPSSSRTGSVMLGRVVTSFSGDAMGNLISEFWPDVRRKFLHKKPKP